MKKLQSGTYKGSKYKLQNYIDDNHAEVFLPEEELLVIVNVYDLHKQKNVFKPKSRIDFHTTVKKTEFTKDKLLSTLQWLLDNNHVTVKNNEVKEELIQLFKSEKHKDEILEEFHRMYKAEDPVVEFKLIGNHNYQKKTFKKKKNNKNY